MLAVLTPTCTARGGRFHLAAGRLGILLLLLLTAGALALPARTPPPMIRIHVRVLSPEGQPVPNAGVVFKQLADSRGKKVKDAIDVEQKTDSRGTTDMDGFVPGRVLIQVIATNLRTFGQIYTVRQDPTQVEIRLQKPENQISIYH